MNGRDGYSDIFLNVNGRAHYFLHAFLQVGSGKVSLYLSQSWKPITLTPYHSLSC
jgi:hypothetical protein